MLKKFTLGLLTLSALSTPAFAASPYTLSPQLDLIGLTPAIQAAAYNGAGSGILFADIDTGIIPQWVGFRGTYNTAIPRTANNINTILSASCINGRCTKYAKDTLILDGNNSLDGFGSTFPFDQNGHGTFTSSQIVGGVQSAGLYSIAPAGKLIEVQVLGANGSGSFADVNAGIKYAANAGARFLNLSLGPSGTAAQMQAAYEYMAPAINYAASKGAIIVLAGGNDAVDFAGGNNIRGFTDAALARLILAGSTDITQTLSFFSNTPGGGHFISSSGKIVPYQNLWVMTDGEDIWGASIYSDPQNGYGYIEQESGTSMSAPQITGIAGLLAARWPSLIKKGTIGTIIKTTTTDIGAAGKDALYGMGFLNAAAAFSSIGTLSVPTSGGTPVLLLGGMTTTSALGSMSGVSGALSHASYYDSFGRDFPADLGAPIKSRASSLPMSGATIRVTGQDGAGARSFRSMSDGGWASFTGSPQRGLPHPDTPTATPITSDPTRTAPAPWMMAIQQANGTYIGAGQGSDAALSFNDARWGEGKTAFANSRDAMGGAVLGLTDTATYSSVGFDRGKDQHISLAIMSTEAEDYTSSGGEQASAYGAAVGYTVTPSENWTLSATGAYLDETDMLLGSPASGYLSFGQAATVSFGMGASVRLGNGFNIGFDTVAATTSPSHNSQSLISSTSRLFSAGASVVVTKENLTGRDDTLGAFVKKPLRVYGGSANVDVPRGEDEDGNPIIYKEQVGLAPSGNETDIGFDYRRPLGYGFTSALSMTYREDADNIAGARDGAAMAYVNLKF